MPAWLKRLDDETEQIFKEVIEPKLAEAFPPKRRRDRSVCSLHEASRALVADVGVGVGVGLDDENGQAGAAQRWSASICFSKCTRRTWACCGCRLEPAR